MEKSQIIHIAGECIVLLGMVTYFNRQTRKLTDAIIDSNEKYLELESKYNDLEDKFNTILKSISLPQQQQPIMTQEQQTPHQQPRMTQEQQIPQQQPRMTQEQYLQYQRYMQQQHQMFQRKMQQQVQQQQVQQQQNTPIIEEVINPVDLDKEIQEELKTLSDPVPSSQRGRESVVDEPTLDEDVETRTAETLENANGLQFVDIPEKKKASRVKN